MTGAFISVERLAEALWGYDFAGTRAPWAKVADFNRESYLQRAEKLLREYGETKEDRARVARETSDPAFSRTYEE